MSETTLSTPQKFVRCPENDGCFLVEERSPILEEVIFSNLLLKLAQSAIFVYLCYVMPRKFRRVSFWLVNLNNNKTRALSREVGRIAGASRHLRLETDLRLYLFLYGSLDSQARPSSQIMFFGHSLKIFFSHPIQSNDWWWKKIIVYKNSQVIFFHPSPSPRANILGDGL